jgi:hypothetical protein
VNYFTLAVCSMVRAVLECTKDARGIPEPGNGIHTNNRFCKFRWQIRSRLTYFILCSVGPIVALHTKRGYGRTVHRTKPSIFGGLVVERLKWLLAFCYHSCVQRPRSVRFSLFSTTIRDSRLVGGEQENSVVRVSS